MTDEANFRRAALAGIDKMRRYQEGARGRHGDAAILSPGDSVARQFGFGAVRILLSSD
jgi:hypothetical protein